MKKATPVSIALVAVLVADLPPTSRRYRVSKPLAAPTASESCGTRLYMLHLYLSNGLATPWAPALVFAQATWWAASPNLGNPADRVFQTHSDSVKRGLLDHPSADQAAFTGRQLEMAHGDAHIHALQVSKP